MHTRSSIYCAGVWACVCMNVVLNMLESTKSIDAMSTCACVCVLEPERVWAVNRTMSMRTRNKIAHTNTHTHETKRNVFFIAQCETNKFNDLEGVNGFKWITLIERVSEIDRMTLVLTYTQFCSVANFFLHTLSVCVFRLSIACTFVSLLLSVFSLFFSPSLSNKQ